MNIAAYPNYKSSGVEWLGNIPTHWEVRRLKFLAEVCNGQDQKEVLDDEGKYLIFGSGGPFGLSVRYLYDQPSVLLGRKGTIDKPLYIEEPFWTVDTMFYTRIQPRVFPKYFFYLCKTIPYGSVSDLTTLPSMTQTGLGGVQFAYVEYEEQQQIAAFLDWKTNQIDALLAKKQTLLQKLKEKRLAFITQAVTKGLNPDAPLRDSGIAWLGAVPLDWQTKRLRHCAGLITSGSRGWAQHFADTGSLFLRITNLTRDSIQLLLDDLQRVEPPDGAEGDRTYTQPGDLLISITADLGSVAVIPDGLEGAYVSQHLSLVRLDSQDIDPRWIAYSILSHIGKYQLVGAGYGGTKVQLSLADIKEIVFCHAPKRDEQQRVLKFIETETAKSDELISLAESAITRLTEYRSALVTAATTGKIDVRNAVIPAVGAGISKKPGAANALASVRGKWQGHGSTDAATQDLRGEN